MSSSHWQQIDRRAREISDRLDANDWCTNPDCGVARTHFHMYGSETVCYDTLARFRAIRAGDILPRVENPDD